MDVMKAELLEDGGVVATQSFDDPQDALMWLYAEAEGADERVGALSGRIDGKPVTL